MGYEQLRYGDSLLILAISFVSACICEGISWLLIYRSPSYKALKYAIDRTSKKLETMKSGGGGTGGPTPVQKSSRTKKMDRFETSLKELSRDLFFFKAKSTAVVAMVLLVVFGLLSSLFEGKPVAKLPFVPVTFLQRMTHRALPGDDPTDCSMTFLYFLCSISIRTNLQKMLGFAPPRGAPNPGMWGMPDNSKVR